MTTRSTPFLTFQPGRGGSADDAMAFYAGLFDDGEIVSVTRRAGGTPGEGTVEVAEFRAAGTAFRCSDSFVEHAWDFTPAISLWVETDSPEEQRRLVAGLVEGGQEFMPLDDYGFGPFAWVQDRFGISWQLVVAPV